MRGEEKRTFDFKRFAVSALIGGAVGVLAALLLLLGAAALTMAGVLGKGTAAAYAAAAAGSLVGGFVAAKRSGAGAIPCAAAVAVTMLAICIVVGLVFYEGFELTNGAATLAALMLAGGLAGAFTGASRGGTRRKSRK